MDPGGQQRDRLPGHTMRPHPPHPLDHAIFSRYHVLRNTVNE